MSSSVPGPSIPPPAQASSSSNPLPSSQSSYRPYPRPNPLVPFQRIDAYAIKQELHDALGEDGLPYWKAMNGYLLGQVGKEELSEMVRGWLKGRSVQLHNRLLLSLLNNASAPTASGSSASALGSRKRKRAGPDDAEFDMDDTTIENRARIHHWVMGLNGKERARVRRSVMGRMDEGEGEGHGDADAGRKKKWSGFSANSTMPPLALSARQLPSSNQLSLRLAQLAKGVDLALSPDASADIGEFLAIGVDSHLTDILHGLVHLTGRERPGDTIRVPTGTKKEDGSGMSIDGEYDHLKSEPLPPPLETGGEIPKPDLETFNSLFTLVPGLHSQASPALYKLSSSILAAEMEMNNPLPPRPPREEDEVESTTAKPTSPRKAMSPINQTKAEKVSQELSAAGLLMKLDKAERQSEGADEGKKGKKHNLHWKYEDPALILKDVLG